MRKKVSDRDDRPRRLTLSRTTIALMSPSGGDTTTEATNTMRSIVASNVQIPCGCIL